MSIPSRKNGRFSSKIRETLIGGNDSFVSFNLREVRIQSEVENHSRADSIFDVQAGINFDGLVHKASEIKQRWIGGQHVRRDRRHARSGF